MPIELNELPGRLVDAATKLESAARALDARARTSATAWKPSRRDDPGQRLDATERLVASLTGGETWAVVARLRDQAPDREQFLARLGTLLRLAPEHGLPETVRAAGADLADALLAVSLDVLHVADLDAVGDAVQTVRGAARPGDATSAAARLLDLVPGRREVLLDGLARSGAAGAALACRIVGERLSFDDLARLPDESVRVLVRDLDRDTLARALVGAPARVLERFTANLTERAARLLEEGMAAAGHPAPDRAAIAEARRSVLDWTERTIRRGEIAGPAAPGRDD